VVHVSMKLSTATSVLNERDDRTINGNVVPNLSPQHQKAIVVETYHGRLLETFAK